MTGPEREPEMSVAEHPVQLRRPREKSVSVSSLTAKQQKLLASQIKDPGSRAKVQHYVGQLELQRRAARKRRQQLAKASRKANRRRR